MKNKERIRISRILLIAVLVLDVLLIILSFYGYYFQILKPTGALMPTLITLIAFYIVGWAGRVSKMWIVLVTLIVLPLIGLFWMWNSSLDYSYASFRSPNGQDVLVIEHRAATLGETNHIYNFYHNVFPGVMKKMNDQSLKIMTRGTDADNLEVLGIDEAIWINDEDLVFRSEFAETKVTLREKVSDDFLVESEMKSMIPIFETDVIRTGGRIENTESLDQFIADFESGQEGEIRYVVLDGLTVGPMAVYTLKARFDSEAGQSWIEISRDYYFDSEGQHYIEPQQCSNVVKDTERGAYFLTECFHTWEVELMPIGNE